MSTANFELRKFLVNLAEMYPVEVRGGTDEEKDEKIKNLIQEYYATIQNQIEKTRKEYDYEKLFELVKKNYQYRKIPNIPFLLDLLPKAVKELGYEHRDLDGKVLVVVLKKNTETGPKFRVSDFIFVPGVSKIPTQQEILSKFRNFYDDVKFRIYPKGTTVMSNKVFIPQVVNGEETYRIDELYPMES